MIQYRAGLRNHPVKWNTLRGYLTLYSSSMDFQTRWGQWHSQINLNIDFQNVIEVSRCSYLLIFPAFEVHIRDGNIYKFVCPESDQIVNTINRYLSENLV